MKKTILSIAALALAASMANAEAISEQQAREFAANYLGTKNIELALTKLPKEGSVRTMSVSGPEFYAFNNPDGGWVIISADDCACPVLVHSDKGSISLESMPDNMKAWLSRASAGISKVSSAKAVPVAKVKAVWQTKGMKTKASTTQKLLETANWDQSTPYNNTVKSKLGTSKDVATGCVATAMAIVLRHHKHPSTGTGTIASYTSTATEDDYGVNETYTIPATNISNYSYNWNSMPLTDGGSTSWSSTQKTAVADLMFHCGAMVQMTYTSEGSGAYSEDIIPALVKHMSYSANAQELYRDNYSAYDWFRMVKAEIDADRPLIYGAADDNEEGGHQFVIDGYNSNYEFHVNWGWGGEGNAWCAINYLELEDYIFSYQDGGIFGLEPASTSYSQLPEIFLMGYTEEGYEDFGLKLASGKIAKGENFTLDIAAMNQNSIAFSSKVRGVLLNSEGELKEVIGSETALSVDAASYVGYYIYYGEGYVEGYSCKITSDIKPGDCVAVQYKKADGTWALLGAYNHTELQEYYAKYNQYSVGKISATGVSYIYVPSGLKAGARFYIDIVGAGSLPTSIDWTVDGNKPTDNSYTLTAGTHTVKATVKYYGGATETLIRQITVK